MCYTSGYVLHPSAGDNAGCEVSYACHLHMKGGGSTNELRRGPLVNGAFKTLVQIAELPAVQKQELELSLGPTPAVTKMVADINPANADETNGSSDKREEGGKKEKGEGNDVITSIDSSQADESSHLLMLRHCSLRALAHLKVRFFVKHALNE